MAFTCLFLYNLSAWFPAENKSMQKWMGVLLLSKEAGKIPFFIFD